MASTTNEMEEFFEKHRHPYEPSNHWKARKQFMINNWDRFSGNQLVSLAMVWSNMEFDGSTYPPELTERVQEMARGITVDDEPMDVDNKPNITVSRPQPVDKPKPTPEVISTTDSSEPVGRRLEEEREGSKKTDKRSSMKEMANTGRDFPVGQVKRKLEEEREGTKFQKTERKPTARERAVAGYDNRLGRQGGKAYQSKYKSRQDQPGNMMAHDSVVSSLADNLLRQGDQNKHLGSALHRLHNAGSKLSLRPDVEFIEIPAKGVNLPPPVRRNPGMSLRDNPTWLCNLYMGDVLMASVVSSNKPNSKTAAAEKAVSILESSHYVVSNEKKVSKLGRNYNKEIVPLDDKLKSQKYPIKTQNKCGAPSPTYNLDGFVLMEQAVPIPPVSTLINSAQSNHVPITFEISDNIGRLNGETGFVCNTIINGVTVATGVHMNKKEVRNISAANALALLKQKCPTLKKNLDNAQGMAINRDELSTQKMKRTEGKSTAIAESNVGHKMLKMMGWKGGALAKDGIVEPIEASEKFSREGLGFIPVPKDSATQKIDLKAVRKILENFVSSGRRDDLIFSSDLSNDERKAIHEVCRRFHLKSKSHGKGQERFLIVRQRRNLNELVQDVAESGGSCGQYELISPGQ